jgi:UDP-N-acetylmuramate dehydrogenase
LDKERIAEILRQIPGGGAITVNEPMMSHTSFKIGGPADVFIKPQNTAGLLQILRCCGQMNVPALVMGNGTNLIVRDKGIRGVVIQITDNMNAYTVEEDEITAEAGILLSRLSRIALEHELTGMEFAEGIPGTLGGAVVMNAGAYDGEMSFVVKQTEYLRTDGEVLLLDNPGHCFGKRSSFIQTDGGVALKTRISLRKGDKAQISEKMAEFRSKRKEKQPLEMPSAGSIFKRPEGNFAGKLVEDCGLRGCRIGGAEVSCLHCGFIVNTGNATAMDVLSLIKYIQDRVYADFGVQLQTEVKIVGEE